jgi:hypothetical protein
MSGKLEGIARSKENDFTEISELISGVQLRGKQLEAGFSYESGPR